MLVVSGILLNGAQKGQRNRNNEKNLINSNSLQSKKHLQHQTSIQSITTMLILTPNKIELTLNPELPCHTKDFPIESAFFNCSLLAPACPDSDRKPVDIVVVLDRSGSMSGDKLELCKKTIQFLMGEMSAHDRLGLVTYDTKVKNEFPLMNMDQEGKAKTEHILKKIHAGSATNLSGGLLAGVQEVQKPTRNDKGKPNPVRSVLILTDGLANAGVTETPLIVSLLRGTLEPNVSIFTFGYGSDHNADMLREISGVGGGVYYFVQNVDGVSLAFADCLGGLLSVVAQNIKLECFAKNGCKIRAIKTRRTTTALVPDEHYEIEMGDIYGEEMRDVLINVSMPALFSENKEFECLECRLSYANILDSSLDKVETSCAVQRLNEVPADQEPDSHITQQRNRVIVAEALEKASEKAEKGSMEEGKNLLQDALDLLTAQMRNLNCEEAKAGSAALIKEIEECKTTLRSRREFKNRGRMRMKCKVQSHWDQRSNDVEVDEYTISEEASYNVLPVASHPGPSKSKVCYRRSGFSGPQYQGYCDSNSPADSAASRARARKQAYTSSYRNSKKSAMLNKAFALSKGDKSKN